MITIYEQGRKVLEVPDLATLKTLAQASHSSDKSTFKVRHKVDDALKEAKNESIISDAALLNKIVKHLKTQGLDVDV